MVCGDHDHIIFPHLLHKRRQPCIKFRESLCITVDVAAMAIQHIKIHQIDKAKTVKITLGILHRVLQTIGVGFGIYLLCNASPGKNIIYFAHRNAIQSRCLNGVQHRFGRRFQRKIMPVGRTRVCARSSHKGTGNHTSYAMLSLKLLTRNSAVSV